MQPPSRAPSAPRLDRQQGGERASIDPPCRASRLVAILIAPSFGKRDFRRSLESPPPLSLSSLPPHRLHRAALLASDHVSENWTFSVAELGSSARPLDSRIASFARISVVVELNSFEVTSRKSPPDFLQIRFPR